MPNSNRTLVTMNYLVRNLNSFMGYKNIASIRELSSYLGFKERRIKSWLSYEKIPALNTLDIVANTIGVHTYELIGKNIRIYENTIDCNNSPKLFYANLRKILNKYDIKTADEFYDYLDHEISKHSYYSYFKTNSPKIPSLRTIEKISSFFDVEPYRLIERSDKHVR